VGQALEKRDSFLNQKSSQSPFSKRRMSPMGTGLPRFLRKLAMTERGYEKDTKRNIEILF